MIELTIKVQAEGWEDIIGIKECIAIALEGVYGIEDVEVVDIELKGE